MLVAQSHVYMPADSAGLDGDVRMKRYHLSCILEDANEKARAECLPGRLMRRIVCSLSMELVL